MYNKSKNSLSSNIENLAYSFYKLATNRLQEDIKDSLDHLRVSADIPDDFPLSTDLFNISYEENFNLNNTNDDLDSWTEWATGELKELTEEDKKDQIDGFRGKWWGDISSNWLPSSFPPIVIINAGNFYEISDGRGRASLALGMGKETLPAVILTLKKPKENQELATIINELLEMINSVWR